MGFEKPEKTEVGNWKQTKKISQTHQPQLNFDYENTSKKNCSLMGFQKREEMHTKKNKKKKQNKKH